MKKVAWYWILFCWLLVWPLSGQASGVLQVTGVLPESFVDCATAKIPAQKLDWLQIKAGQSYCLAMTIHLPETSSQERLPHSPALFISALGAGQLYLDGKLIASNGKPALNAENETPGQIEYLYPLPLAVLQPGTYQLRMQLSTHHAPRELFQYFYALDLVDAQAHWHERQQQLVFTLLLCGALAMAAIMVAALGLALGQRTHWLVFGALALATACLLLVESWRSLFGYLYSAHYLRLQLIWFFALLFSVLLPAYFMLLYRFSLPKPGCYALIAGFAASYFLPFSQDGKVLLLMEISLLLCLFFSIAAVYRQRPGSHLGLGIVLVVSGLFAYQYWHFAEQGFVWIVLLLMLSLLYQLVNQWVHDQHKAELALQLENQLLHKSLQPHFLMNCLELVNELQRENPAQAEHFIQSLAEEFRLLTQYANQSLIPFEQELHLCRNYLQLMTIRLQQPHQLEITGDHKNLRLPPAALLVLLENAFSHNKYETGQVFLVSLQPKKETMVINVNLPMGNKRAHQGSGTGTAHLQQSLHRCFSGKAKLSSAIENNHWLVSIELPV